MTRGVCVLLVLLSGVAWGEKPAPKQPEPPPADPEGSDAAPTPEEIEASLPPHVTGPKSVDLGNDIEIDVPAGMVLYERVEAQDISRKLGNDPEGVIGIITTPEPTGWMLYLDYDDAGYVTDDDSDNLDANTLLSQIKQGTIEQNKQRKAQGIPELLVDGWNEAPHYDKHTHHLVWGTNNHDTGGEKNVNYVTRILGRNGYVATDLVDVPETLAQSKLAVAPVMAGLRFRPGARYEDHKSGDKSSGFGLTALVVGGAGYAIVKGGGFFITLLLVLKKGLIVIAAAIGGFFRWLFGKKKRGPIVPTDPPSDVTPPTAG